MKIIKFSLLFTVIVFLSSCATPRVAYLQDRNTASYAQIANPLDIRVRPEDKISIIVNSKDQALSNLFNLPIVSQRIGQSSSSTSSSSQGISGYTIDKDGNIDFPVLGKIHIAGMNREEIAIFVKEKLISEDLVKDPIVTVEFMNLTVSVLGEVAEPGRVTIDKDRLTLLDAISMAGDLTIYGKRDNVLVQRESRGKLVTYVVDLSAGADLYNSPAYYLQQNDIVYIEPNAVRARQSTVNGNNVRSASFWMSLASLLTTITFFIVK